MASSNVQAAAAVLVMAMMVVMRTQGATVTPSCLPFTEYDSAKGKCVPTKELKNALHRQEGRTDKRAQGVTCPYCAVGIWDVFPLWDSACKLFIFCLNGTTTELDCTEMGHKYYNPTTKICEDFDSETNSCLHRSYSLLNYNPTMTG